MTHIAKSTGKPDKRMTKRPKGFDAVGRPEKAIDWNKVDELLISGCTGSEVAAFCCMHPATFYKRVADKHGVNFTTYSQEKKYAGESIIRAQQFAKAIGVTKEGDNTLLIWLGKQRLGQTETQPDKNFSEDAIKNFSALMEQLNTLQKKDENLRHSYS